MKKRKARFDWTKNLFIFVLITLVGSVVYAIVGIVTAPAAPVSGLQYEKIKTDYALMLVQCAVGILVMFLPSILERRLKIAIPGGMYAVFVIFLYGAIYLGEVRSYYFRFPHWDLVLHSFSGLMLGALSFSVISLLNNTQRVRITLSPVFVAIFAFSFAVAGGVVWEVYEFTLDGLLGFNMQKYMMENGTALVGRAALKDTMGDLIVDSLGAAVMSLVGFISIKYKKGWLSKFMVRRVGRPGK